MADTGIGIEPNILVCLFSAFTKIIKGGELNTEGVGLTISKNLIEAMGGGITVDSVVGIGVRFHTLPLQEPLEKTANSLKRKRSKPHRSLSSNNLVSSAQQPKITDSVYHVNVDNNKNLGSNAQSHNKLKRNRVTFDQTDFEEFDIEESRGEVVYQHPLHREADCERDRAPSVNFRPISLRALDDEPFNLIAGPPRTQRSD